MKNKSMNDKWIKFLDPENLKGNLIFSSLYIATFESYKDYVNDQVKSFYTTGFKENKMIISEDYKAKVIAKDIKHKDNASLLWLCEMEIINQDDYKIYEELRKYRNKLAHELINLVFDDLLSELPEKLNQLLSLKIKTEKNWIYNVEIPITFDCYQNDEKEIKKEDIITSSQMLYKIIFDMLSDEENTANYYKNELRKCV